MVDDNCFSSPFGALQLTRASRTQSRTEQNLRAWDAADELLLANLASFEQPKGARILLANDGFGALVCSLPADWQIDFCSDSHLSTQAAKINLAANEKPQSHIQWHTSLGQPTEPLDVLAIKLPKSLSLLEDQLLRYRPLCSAKTRVIAAGMVKHMSAGAFALIQKYLGPTRTSLAEKKARLIFCTPGPEATTPATNPYPKRLTLEDYNVTVTNHANVFSRDALDIGTRFFLAQLPGSTEALRLADLGCGNGLVGVALAGLMPMAKIDFYDESFMALASARTTMGEAFPTRVDQCRFIADDCMASAEPEIYDAIFCNPPFHQHNVVGGFVANQMFHDARRALKPGGALWVVGNRHLGYHQHLKRLFGNLTQVAANKKFVVFKVVKR
ncbi:methyltransferase [Simiduia sp. 21SJ11W-1]|uniref:methyltransferase n=1 Tax=Simiduia sp. 21SJ11W-1 TaxID=2909669 RepID=UPI0020A1A282|nr:methyltransferase [Simiduia sp. 21SJ11W-1]UTA47854.1 methyltransferase [Simiduia sp. 21SJ11W-1]